MTVPVALFFISKCIKNFPILFFYNGQGTNTFCQDCKNRRMNSNLTCFSGKHSAFHTHIITNIQQFEMRVEFFTNIVPLDEKLNPPFQVHHLCKRCFSHFSNRHDATCNFDRFPFQVIIIGFNGFTCMRRIKICGVRIDSIFP